MAELKLIHPTRTYGAQIWDLRDALKGEFATIPGTNGLADVTDLDTWFSTLENPQLPTRFTCETLTSSTYLAVRESDDCVVGMVDIRHQLDDYLYHFGGNIGYCVKPTERLKGYAKEMLRLALEECTLLGINDILITCSNQNNGSIKTILANGGIFENEVDRGDKIIQRYWIHTRKAQYIAG